MKIARMLQLYRVSQGLDQKVLAAEIGINPSTLSRIENGKAVQADSLVKLIVWLFKEE